MTIFSNYIDINENLFNGTNTINYDNLTVTKEAISSGKDINDFYKPFPYCPVFLNSNINNIHEPWVFNCYITGEILDISRYLDLLDALNTARPSDTINIYIDSPGGAVTTGSIIASNIASCKGNVITIARGIVASAAALIWSSGHTCVVEPFSNFMFHMSKHSDYGNSVKVADKSKLIIEYVIKCLLAEAIKKGHITKKELEIITDTQDEIWVSAEKMSKRVQGISEEYESPDIHAPSVSDTVPYEKHIFGE